jgi:hypothetical protein
MQGIQTERPVVVAEQVVEIDIFICLGHVVFVIYVAKI